jgi:hypothetical protein
MKNMIFWRKKVNSRRFQTPTFRRFRRRNKDIPRKLTLSPPEVPDSVGVRINSHKTIKLQDMNAWRYEIIPRNLDRTLWEV